MKAKALKVLAVGGILSSIAIMVWPGCATPPLPSSRQPLAARSKDFSRNVSFVKAGETRVAEITNLLGAFDAFYPNMNVGAYALTRVTKKRLWLLLGVIPIGVTKSSNEIENAYFEMDEQGRVRRFGVVKTVADLREGAARWLVTGHWVCVSAITNGTALPETALSRLGIRFDGERFYGPSLQTDKANEVLFDGACSIDEELDPMGFSIIEKPGPANRRTAKGICSIRNDTLQVCFSLSEASNPKTFQSSPGSGAYLIRWERKERK